MFHLQLRELAAWISELHSHSKHLTQEFRFGTTVVRTELRSCSPTYIYSSGVVSHVVVHGDQHLFVPLSAIMVMLLGIRFGFGQTKPDHSADRSTIQTSAVSLLVAFMPSRGGFLTDRHLQSDLLRARQVSRSPSSSSRSFRQTTSMLSLDSALHCTLFR